jgi:hypothetical protein
VDVHYIGNFSAPHSTESHVAQALHALDVDLVCHQENEVDWTRLHKAVSRADLVLWTTTHDYAPEATYDMQRAFLAACDPPVVSYHLDRWWGLGREYRLQAPFFSTNLAITADGGHNDDFLNAGINHYWMPPGVSEFECGGGTFRDELQSSLAFVGSWQGAYHAEWTHRRELVAFLRHQYRSECVLWPKRGEHAVRGEALRDLYASVDILIGDSCLAGGAARYWSDRIPETLGRGGFLIHPEVVGLEEHYTPGEHLVTWPAGDWQKLHGQIRHYLAHPEQAERIAAAGRAHVLATATYTVRMRQLLKLVKEAGWL